MVQPGSALLNGKVLAREIQHRHCNWGDAMTSILVRERPGSIPALSYGKGLSGLVFALGRYQVQQGAVPEVLRDAPRMLDAEHGRLVLLRCRPGRAVPDAAARKPHGTNGMGCSRPHGEPAGVRDGAMPRARRAVLRSMASMVAVDSTMAVNTNIRLIATAPG